MSDEVSDPTPATEATPALHLTPAVEPAKVESRVPFKAVLAPMAPTSGYLPSSFGLNLSPKAAQALADLMAGYAAAGVRVNDHGHAVNVLLENLADA